MTYKASDRQRETKEKCGLPMALFRLMLTVCVCAAGLTTAQDIFSLQQYGLYSLVLYSDLLQCPFNQSMELDVSQVKIYMYDNKNNINKTYYVNESLADPNLDFDRPFLFYVMGFNDKINSSNQDHVRENSKCLKNSNLYIIEHNYYTGVSNLLEFFADYDKSVKYHYCIGKAIAKILAALVDFGVLLKNILVMGHSLGAHIAGVIGKVFYALTGQKLPRIDGCDPAGPCFDKMTRDNNLNSDDADEVHTWHCNAGQLGTKYDYCNASFYSDGGEGQLGCNTPIIPEILLSGLASNCSHHACPKLCTMPFCHPELWPAKLCNSQKNYASGACDGNDSCLASPLTSNLSGNYYLTTKGYSIL